MNKKKKKGRISDRGRKVREKSMTYAQRKRASYSYRSEYFKHNPGLFGQIWFCAYCHAPIIGKSNVQVDHIIPLNCILGQNARYNLVAACPKCNNAKSDKVDARILTGYTSKGIEVLLFSIQKLFIVAFVAFMWLLHKIVNSLISLVTLPFRQQNWKLSLGAGVIYASIFYYILVHVG